MDVGRRGCPGWPSTQGPGTSGRNTATVKLRLALNARDALVPLALFALAFLGSLFAMRIATPLAGPIPPDVPANDAGAPHAAAARPAAAIAGPPAAFSAPLVAEAPNDATEPLPVDVPLPTVRESFATLKTFGTRDERVRAIEAISEAARQGSDLARARQALRLAASDPDPEVAARAQEEYEQVAERDER
jgi:hypothetical protein